MTDQALTDVTKVYACSQAISYATEVVQFETLHIFSGLLKQLTAGLESAVDDEFWSPIVGPLKYFWFDICAAPLSQEYLAGRAEKLEVSLRDCKSRGTSAYPSVMRLVDALASQLKRMSESRLDHLLGKTAEIVKRVPQAQTALLVKHPRLIEPVESAISRMRDMSNCTVISLASLREVTCYDRLMVFGLPGWYPDYVFSAPRASELVVFKYQWMRGVWRSTPVLAELSRAKVSRPERPEMPERAEGGGEIDWEKLLPNLDWIGIAAQVARDVDDGGNSYSVEAKAYALEDHRVVFLEADNDATALVIDISEAADKRVQRLELRDIEPGMFILLRTAGGGDYILPLADKLMGNDSKVARQQQRHWKQLLRAHVARQSITKVAAELRQLGCQVAKPINVANWTSERNIHTHSKDDFLVILKFVGLADRAEEYWATMEKISNAHRHAGHDIRDMLLEQVSKANLEQLNRKGFMEFELPDKDAGSLTAYRITAISGETSEVAPSLLGVPVSPKVE